MLQSYSKPYLSIDDQLNLLSARGMGMSQGRDHAARWLGRIGYYRLSGYWYPFRERDADGTALETFRPGTQLSHAFDLYVFDKRLRLLMLDAIERIEVALRVDIALLIGKSDPWAHRRPGNFNRYFNSPDEGNASSRHMEWLSRSDQLCDRSREEFAKHFRNKYSGPFPIWIAVELWGFRHSFSPNKWPQRQTPSVSRRKIWATQKNHADKLAAVY